MSDIFPDIIPIAQAIWFFISHGGWIILVLLTTYILYLLYMNEIQTQYLQSIEWVFLEIRPPKENLNSFYSAEQVFLQLHSLFDNWSFQEKYIEGKLVFWISLEIISLGGTISYLIKVPKKQVDYIESTFYANFPNIEIQEVNDFLANFEYNPDDDKYELFGAEIGLLQPQSIPIRTYKEFEGLKSPDGDTIVDPLAPLFEAFSRVGANEFIAVQFLIRPVADGSWKDEAEALVDKLRGDLENFNLDEVTRMRVTSIKSKLGKPGYQTKIRMLHMGLKGDFNKNAKKMILSPFKIFSSANYNGFKPGFAPKLDYRISPTLEAPYINYYVRQRKIDLFRGYKSRSQYIGTPMYVLNTEELATLFHFPITTTAAVNASVSTTDMKKSQPPANLPI